MRDIKDFIGYWYTSGSIRTALYVIRVKRADRLVAARRERWLSMK